MKSTRRLKIHQRGSKTNLLDDKNKLLEEVAKQQTKKTNEISKAQSEEYVNTVNEVCKHMVFWK